MIQLARIFGLLRVIKALKMDAVYVPGHVHGINIVCDRGLRRSQTNN